MIGTDRIESTSQKVSHVGVPVAIWWQSLECPYTISVSGALFQLAWKFGNSYEVVIILKTGGGHTIAVPFL